MNNKLKIIATEQNPENRPSVSRKKLKRQATQAKFDQLWTENPEQFNPERNSMQKEQLERTFQLICNHCKLPGKRIVDLGCGQGALARKLAAAGALVDAVDISPIALNLLRQESPESIQAIHDYIPSTSLMDETYDLVISTEVIAYLHQEERRLYMAEMARLVKSDGWIICSTAIDINTTDGPQAFGTLLETEFLPVEWVFSYFAYTIRMKNFLNHISASLAQLFSNNHSILLKLESLCKTFSSDSGISHVIFIGQRRPFIIPTQEELMAIEPKGKRQVWE